MKPMSSDSNLLDSERASVRDLQRGTSKVAPMLPLAESDPAKRRFRVFHPTAAMQEMANFLLTGER